MWGNINTFTPPCPDSLLSTHPAPSFSPFHVSSDPVILSNFALSGSYNHWLSCTSKAHESNSLFYFTLSLFELHLAETSGKVNTGQLMTTHDTDQFTGQRIGLTYQRMRLCFLLGAGMVYLGHGISGAVPCHFFFILMQIPRRHWLSVLLWLPTALRQKICALFKGGNKPSHS